MGCRASVTSSPYPVETESVADSCSVVSLQELSVASDRPEDQASFGNDELSPAPRPIRRRWSSDSLSSTCSLLSLPQVAAGHGGASILKYVAKDADSVPEIAEYVMKVYDETEARVYQELQDRKDLLLRFTARFFGEVDKDDVADDLDGRYMRLTNLLRGFSLNPHVMDCKLGIRSFGEQEVFNTALRQDLYRKLIDLDPDEATEEERQQGTCTKHRWMSFNDRQTTLHNLGFRIDGIAHSAGKVEKSALKALKGLPDVVTCIVKNFLPSDDSPSSLRKGDVRVIQTETSHRAEIAMGILTELRKLRETLYVSEFVKKHSFIGCSLLFVAEAHGTGAGVFLIDFAKTVPVPQHISVDHRSPWKQGNHEDGLFLGVDNMIRCWELVTNEIGLKPDVAYPFQCRLEDEATGRIRTRVYL